MTTMQKICASLAAACTIGVLVLIVSGTASASGAISVSGTYAPFDDEFGSTTCSSDGDSGFMFTCTTTGLTFQYSGSLVGLAVADFTAHINCKTSRVTSKGVETFTGSVEGVGSGTLTYIDQSSWDIDCSTFFPFSVSNIEVNSVAVKGSGGLAGLQGRIVFTDTTYSGTLH
jgi:hypothetical protein